MPLNPSNTLRSVRVPASSGSKVGRTVPAGSVQNRPSSASANRPSSGSGTRRTGTSAASASSSGYQPQYVSTNQHQGPSAAPSNLSSSETHWFDKYHKLLEEHLQIKQERKDQDQRLTDITTKFRKVTRDLKLSGFDESEAASATADIVAPYHREIAQLKEKLAHALEERDKARQDAAELRKLMGMRPSGQMSGTTSSSAAASAAGAGGHRGSSASHHHHHHQQGDIVDVSSLINRKNNSNLALVTSTQQHQNIGGGMQNETIEKLRAALQDEISKNERLGQHCENLRSQLAVAAGQHQQQHQQHTPSSYSYSSSTQNSVRLQEEQANTIRTLRDEIVSLNTRLSEYRNAVENLQREKSQLEHENHSLKIQAASSSSPTTASATTTTQPQAVPPNQFQATPSSYQQQSHLPPPPAPSSYPHHQPPVVSVGPHTAAGHADATLHQLSHDLSAQVSTLSQRLDHSQGQVQILRGECERLLGELKRIQSEAQDARKRSFEVEQESNTLRIKAARADELELALRDKSDQLIESQQELLRLVDKLQTCTRETESQIRLEYSARLADMDALRDEAERNRKSRERELFSANQDLNEAKRNVEYKNSEIEHLSRELKKLQNEHEELRDKTHAVRTNSVRDASDAQLVQEAVVSVMNSQQGQHHHHHHHRGDNTSNAAAAAGGGGELHNEWNEKWELQQLREQSAQAILDREMSEQRAADFELAVQRKNELIKTMMEERDQLLLENLELRRRLSGVQTTFARTIEGGNGNNNSGFYAAAAAAASGGGGDLSTASNSSSIMCSVTVTLTEVSLNNFGGLMIASLDGVEGFECGVSEPFAVLSDGTPTGPGIEIPFRFSNISPKDEHLVNSLRDAFFNLQIHQVREGSKSSLVAIGRVPAGASLAACLETGSTTSRIELLGGDGAAIGGTSFTTAVDNPALPLALLPPIDAQSCPAARLGFKNPNIDPDVMRSMLLAMRAVRGVRIQILRCNNLRDKHDPNKVPMPYVFYTASLEGGSSSSSAPSSSPLAHVIADTAVHTRTRVVTPDPVFDVEPKDHIFRVFDHQVADFFRKCVLSFIVYDVNCERPEENIGVTSISLAQMLDSPTTSLIHHDYALKPQGSISFTISWIK